jgi:hypothetical protein
VIRRRGHGIATTFTVRKISFGVGVERTFPLHSPRIQGIKVLRSGKVRRAKLYYLRDLSGKAARIEEVATVASKHRKPKFGRFRRSNSLTSRSKKIVIIRLCRKPFSPSIKRGARRAFFF